MLIVPRKFPYNASYKKMILCGATSAFAAYFFAQEGMTNDRGLSIDYIIKFDATGATIFYWILCGICILGVLAAIAAMVSRRMSPKELEIGDNAVTIPHGFLLSKMRCIKFSEITAITETVVSRQTFLYLYTSSGKIALSQSLLPEKDDYEQIKQFLMQQLRYFENT